jgi:hypothetical protein
MIHSEIYKMLEKYPTVSPLDSRNALKEIIQEVTLHTLSKTDFFLHAAFYGGTALRIFYGLDRFSGDMGFSLKAKESTFDLQSYLPAIEKGLASYGFEMYAYHKFKQQVSPVQPAFIKGNTLVHLIKITTHSPPYPGFPIMS